MGWAYVESIYRSNTRVLALPMGSTSIHNRVMGGQIMGAGWGGGQSGDVRRHVMFTIEGRDLV
jgi:hypothetical protein